MSQDALPPLSRGLRAALVRAWPALLAVTLLSLPWLASPMFLDDWHLLWRASQADWSFAGLSRAFTFLDPDSLGTWNLPWSPAYHYFRPLVAAAYKLEMELWGLAPLGFHSVSLALHLASVVLAGVLGARLSGRDRVGRLTALLFAIQPHNVAAVLWTSGRTESLGAVWILASLVSYVIARQERRPRVLAWTILFTLVACLTKENAVVIGAFAGVWELHHLATRRESAREWRRTGLPALTLLGALLGGFVLYRFCVFDPVGTLHEPYFTSPLAPYFPLFALAKTVNYLGALLTTVPVVPIFGEEYLAGHPWALIGVAALSIAGFWGIAASQGDRRLALLAGAWLVIPFLPTLPILASDLYPYLAGVGFALLLAGALDPLTRGRRAALTALVVLYAVSFSGHGLLYYAQGAAERTAREDVERELGGPAPAGTRLLLVNMPVVVAHLASELRLRAGQGDVHAVLTTLTPEWSVPTEGPRVECLGPKTVRIGPPPGSTVLFETPEEWNLQLFRIPLVPGKSYPTSHGFTATPVWRDGHAVALDLDFDAPLDSGRVHVFSFHQDAAGRLAHPVCTHDAPKAGG